MEEPRTAATIEAEIQTLQSSLRAQDDSESDREKQRAHMEGEVEELFVRQELGEPVTKKIAKLRDAYEKLKLAPDRRRALRAAISQRNAELQRVRRKEAGVEAARLARESRDRISSLETDLFRIARKLRSEMGVLNHIYSRAIAGKLVGPSYTPRSLMFTAVRQAFGEWLHPAMEGPVVKGEHRPLREYLTRLASKADQSPATPQKESGK